MNTDQPIADVVYEHLRSMLTPRNKGLISIIETEKRFWVTLGRHRPFMRIHVDDAEITLMVDYPEEIKKQAADKDKLHYNEMPDTHRIKPFSKKPRTRAKEIKDILSLPVMSPRRSALIQINDQRDRPFDGERITFDLYHPKSLGMAEFYINTIITKVRHLVTSDRFRGICLKDKFGCGDLTSLLDDAKREYDTKVRKSHRKNRQRK